MPSCPLRGARGCIIGGTAKQAKCNPSRTGGVFLSVMTNIKMALFTIAGTSAYLGLAILGEGGFTAFFSLPPLVALAVVTFVLAVAALFTAGNLSSGEREDRGNRWVIAAFGIIGPLIGYVPAYPDLPGLW